MRAPGPYRSVLLPCLGLIAGAWLAACVEGPTDPGTDNSRGALIPCSTDLECVSAGLVCDPLRRSCVCTADSMCAGTPERPFCNAFTGRCVAEVAGCRSDDECQQGEFCDVARRTCRVRRAFCEPCSYDLECGGPEDLCVRASDSPTAPTFCATACDSSGGCPAGRECRETNRGLQCVPEGGRCGASLGCNPNSGQTCSVDGHCTQGADQVCDFADGTCRARQSGCASGQACDPSSRQCVLSCEADRDCAERYGPGYQCDPVHQVCLRAPVCHEDGDCPEDEFCLKEPGRDAPSDAGSCTPSCYTDSDCPIAQRCLSVPGEGNRFRCQPGCLVDPDCPMNARCIGGSCETKDPQGRQYCQSREVCEYMQVCNSEKVCVAPVSDRHCTACDQGCGSGLCQPVFASKTCDSSLQCPVGTTRERVADPSCDGHPEVCSDRGQWVPCAYACVFQRCLQRCGSDNDCPKGFGCSPYFNFCEPANAEFCL